MRKLMVTLLLSGLAMAASANVEEKFKASCTFCHSTGAAGAPKAGDKAAWAPRL